MAVPFSFSHEKGFSSGTCLLEACILRKDHHLTDSLDAVMKFSTTLTGLTQDVKWNHMSSKITAVCGSKPEVAAILTSAEIIWRSRSCSNNGKSKADHSGDVHLFLESVAPLMPSTERMGTRPSHRILWVCTGARRKE